MMFRQVPKSHPLLLLSQTKVCDSHVSSRASNPPQHQQHTRDSQDLQGCLGTTNLSGMRSYQNQEGRKKGERKSKGPAREKGLGRNMEEKRAGRKRRGRERQRRKRKDARGNGKAAYFPELLLPLTRAVSPSPGEALALMVRERPERLRAGPSPLSGAAVEAPHCLRTRRGRAHSSALPIPPDTVFCPAVPTPAHPALPAEIPAPAPGPKVSPPAAARPGPGNRDMLLPRHLCGRGSNRARGGRAGRTCRRC